MMIADRHYESMLAMRDAARALGVTVRTLQRWDGDGKIRCVRTAGGHRRVPESEVLRLLDAGGKRLAG